MLAGLGLRGALVGEGRRVRRRAGPVLLAAGYRLSVYAFYYTEHQRQAVSAPSVSRDESVGDLC